MPWLGFEPRRLAALPPQDSVSTSFTTRAGAETYGGPVMMYRLAILVLVLAACSRPQEPPVAAAPLTGSGDWTLYNGTLSGERYSALNQITTANVARLEQACAFETSDTVSFQSGIVAVNGTLYVTT